MAKYKITSSIETEVEADDEYGAIEKFWKIYSDERIVTIINREMVIEEIEE